MTPHDLSTATCYRHPDRAAAVGCQRCERPICPLCMQPASVGFQCPECSHTGARPAVVRRHAPIQRLRRPIATMTMMALNALVFVIDYAEGFQGQVSRLQIDGATQPVLVGNGEWWRLITGGFLHAGVLHLGMNLLFIWIFGQVVESLCGTAGFLSIYAAGLLGGSLGVILMADPRSVTVGASGAGFALMGVLVVHQLLNGASLWNSGLGATVVLNLVVTFTLRDQISVGGHVGGLVIGMVTGAIFFLGPRSGLPRWVRTAGTGALAVCLLGVAMAVASARYGIAA